MKPNILLITSDQQHWSTLGAINPFIRTPNLDRLARMGTRYDRAYCPNPTCTPTRASLITGLYPSQHGAWSLGTKLDENLPTLGGRLSAAGYATGLVGKAHFQPLASTPDQSSLECHPLLRDLDFWRRFHGPWYGFDQVELARNHADEHLAGQHYAIWMEEKGLKDWADYFQPPPGSERRSLKAPNAPYQTRHERTSTDRTWRLPEEYHYSVWTAERSLALIREAVEAEKPFFVWSSFHDPHPPYAVPEPFASLYRPEDMPIGRAHDDEFARMSPWHREARKPPGEADFGGCDQTGFGIHGGHSHLHDESELRADMACYYGMITLMDREIGRLFDYLDEADLWQNTVVVFTTDHGHFLGHHGLTAKGIFNYEDVIKVPMLVKTPGAERKGDAVSGAIQSLVDFTPTFLEAAGLEIDGSMTGVSQWEVWTGRKEHARDHALVEHRFQPRHPHIRTYVNERYKITLWKNQTYGELFDLKEDPGELNNLWADPAARELKLELLLKYAYAEMDREPMRYPRIARA